MAKLYFKVGADYDKVIKLREECKRLEAQLISMNKNLDPKAFREVEKQMQSTKKEYMAIATEAGRAGAEMGEKLKKQIFNSSQTVNTMSERISDQRVKVRDLSIEVRQLSENYRVMDKSNPQRVGLKTNLDSLRGSLEKEKSTLFSLQTEQGKNRLSVKKLRDEYALYDDKVTKTVNVNNGLGGSFKSVIAGAGIVFSVQQAVQLAKSVVQVRGEFQQLDVAFTTLLQSKDKANVLMSQMTELAAKTPFSLMEVATGAKQLTAYGFKAEEITGTLSRLGDIASGLGLPMERLAYLYGTTMTQGRLYARDLMQFTTSGIPMLQGLADMYGITTEEVNKMVSAGKIGFPEVQKVVENLTNEGGKFYNLMEEQSKTITGKISNLGDAIDIMFNGIGQSQEGAINGAIDGAKYLVENYDDVLNILKSLLVAYGSYKAVLIATVAYSKSLALFETAKGFAQMTTMLRGSTKAMILLNQAMGANPILKIISLLIAAGSALYMFAKNTNEAREELSDIARLSNDTTEEFGKQASKIKALQDIINNGNIAYEDRRKALNELKTVIPEYNAELTAEGKIVNDNTDAIKTYLTLLERQIKLKAFQEELEEKYKRKIDAERKISKLKEEIKSMDGPNSSLSQDTPSKFTDVAKSQAKAALTIHEGILNIINAEIDKVNKTIELTDKLDKKNKDVELNAIITRIKTTQKDLSSLQNKNSWTTEEEKRIVDLTSALSDYQSKYKLLTGNDFGKTDGGKQKDYTTQVEKEKQNKERLYTDLGFVVRQAEIDGMEDGLNKVLAQNKLNFDKEKEQIIRQKEEHLSIIQGYAKIIWESENPNWEKQGKKFVPDAIKLPEDDNKTFTIMETTAEIKFKKSDSKAYEDELKSYESFAKAYLTKKQEFNDSIINLEERSSNSSSIEEQEVAEKNIIAVTEMQNKILSGLDEQMEMKNQTFVTFIEGMVEMGLEELLNALTTAESALNTEMANGGDNKSEISRLNGQIASLKNRITQLSSDRKKEGNEKTEVTGDPTKKWKDTLSVMNDVKSITSDITENFEGLDESTKGVLDAAMSIATGVISMIIGITTLATGAAAATTVTATTATTAIKGVEKASVILAIISAALQIAMAIANLVTNLFSKDKNKEKAIKSLQVEVDGLDKAYKNLEKSIDKAFSANAARLIKEEEANLRRKKKLIEEQIQLEESKKKTDDEKINDYNKAIDDIDKKLEETNDRVIKAIAGTDVMSAIDEFADAYMDAWSAGEDKATAMKDVVRKMVKGAVLELVKSKLSPEVTSFMNFLTSAMSDGILTVAEQKTLDALDAAIYDKLQILDGNLDKYIKDSDLETQKATSKSFQTMDQETGNELKGTFSALRIDTSSIRQQNEAGFKLLSKMDVDLGRLLTVNSETKGFAEEIRNIQKDSFFELQGINKNTKSTATILTAMASDISIMKEKL